MCTGKTFAAKSPALSTTARNKNLSNVSNIWFGVPPENIVALFDAAYDFGFYD